jgi:hypothetical protein
LNSLSSISTISVSLGLVTEELWAFEIIFTCLFICF